MIVFQHIRKQYPGVLALDDVGFEVRRGECHALLGENGAGKSTLGKILAGIIRPDGGKILLDGKEVGFASPRDAAQAGVGVVHQELVFCPNLSVAENLCLHDLPQKGRRLDRVELKKRARNLLAQIGLKLDVDLPISELSIAQEQMVQIAAAVGLGAKILVFDEPTSSLGKEEVRRLFKLINSLRTTGVTMIYVSHRLEEIFEICQTVTVLRDGRHVGTLPVKEVDHDALVRMMVGRDVTKAVRAPRDVSSHRPRLEVRRFSSPGKFDDVNFQVRAGEIVGLAGLVGAGRSEIAEALFGLDDRATGEIFIDGAPARIDSPRAAIHLGMGLIPEDRKRQGLILGMSVRENLTLSILDRFRRLLNFIDRGGEKQAAAEACRALSVRAPDLESPVNSLSGGNQQKIVLFKGISTGGRILLIDEPTRGVDVGAKQEIHEQIYKLAQQGAAILLVSSDLPELLALSDRVLILRAGRLVGNLTRPQAAPETVLRCMAGLEQTASAREVN